MRRSTQIILITLFVLAALVWLQVADKYDTRTKLYFLDIGQGDAIYGKLPSGFDFLIDGGPNDRVLDQLAEVMTPGDMTIDLVVPTHNDADHIGGLPDVLEKYHVNEIWINGAIHTTNLYQDLLAAISREKEAGAMVAVVTRGKTKQSGDSLLTVLAPFESYEGKRPEEQNDASIVIKLTSPGISALLTGDAETPLEQRLVTENKPPFELKSDVLKVGHHGSAGSTSEDFLKAVSPKYAIISVGRKNRYGHPTDRVLNLLKDFKIPTYRTDQQGRIAVFSNGQIISVETQK